MERRLAARHAAPTRASSRQVAAQLGAARRQAAPAPTVCATLLRCPAGPALPAAIPPGSSTPHRRRRSSNSSAWRHSVAAAEAAAAGLPPPCRQQARRLSSPRNRSLWVACAGTTQLIACCSAHSCLPGTKVAMQATRAATPSCCCCCRRKKRRGCGAAGRATASRCAPPASWRRRCWRAGSGLRTAKCLGRMRSSACPSAVWQVRAVQQLAGWASSMRPQPPSLLPLTCHALARRRRCCCGVSLRPRR